LRGRTDGGIFELANTVRRGMVDLDIAHLILLSKPVPRRAPEAWFVALIAAASMCCRGAPRSGADTAQSDVSRARSQADRAPAEVTGFTLHHSAEPSALPTQVPDPASDHGAPSSTALASADPAPVEPVRFELVDVEDDVPVYVLRGARGPWRMVFLHSACWQGLGHSRAFQNSAAAFGRLIVLPGDVWCDGAYRTWSLNVERTASRIDAALQAGGDPQPPREVILIGYSLGATMAQRLAERWPDRFSRIILIGAPDKPSAHPLRRVRAVLTMAGELDRQDLMKQGALELQHAGVASTFMILPGAAHGWMGPEAEQVMDHALHWLTASDGG
jgi:pimeloyl-ACP methyl ester carboxylesterase